MKRGIWGLLGLLSVAIAIQAQDTLWVKVTYYDFHSDRSNPEFEQPYDGKDHYIENMVADTLDAEGKPVLGTNPFRNNYIKYWYRDWNSSNGAKGDSTVPKYIYGNFESSVILNETPNFKWFSTTPDNNAITALQSFNGKYANWPNKKHYLNYTIPGTTSGELTYFVEWFADIIADGDTTLNHDTSFINKVIKDSIPFVDEDGSGHYVYKNDNFYPLDGRGFGTEWTVHDAQYILDNNQWAVPVSYLTQPDGDYPNVNNGYNNLNFKKVTVDGVSYFIDNDFQDTLGLQISDSSLVHNYAFTMEMDYEFVMEAGLQFKFSGDDDLWVFIDGKKVLDLGGIHSPATDSFSIDDINTSLGLNLQNDSTYSLKAFYAERHSDSSHILITTNIVPIPGKVTIDLDPKEGSLKAGDEILTATLIVEDKSGDTLSGDAITKVVWDFDTDVNGINTFDTTQDNGKKLIFDPTEAWTTQIINVTVTYIDPASKQEITITQKATIDVYPGQVADIYIEDSWEKPTDPKILRDPNELDEVYIMSGQTENSDFYAIERDKYGNWIGPSTGMNDANWTDNDKDFLDAQAGDASKGQGKAVLLDFANGQTAIVTASNKGFKDSINVIITGIKFTLETATYYDNDPSNPDGYIDLVVVTLDSLSLALMADSSVSTETVMNGIKQYIELTSDKKLTFTTDDFTATSNGFEISVKQDKSKLPDTDVNETDKLIQNQQTEISGFATMFKDTLNVIDKVAPVIIKVIYDPNNSLHEKKKTLTVVFSETVDKPDEDVLGDKLVFFDDNGTTYKMVLKTMEGVNNNDQDTSFTFEVVEIDGKDNPVTGDSVSLDVNSGITDTEGNTQNDKTSPITINVNPYENTVSIGVLGPFTPNDKIENIGEIKDFLNVEDKGDIIKDEGTIIVINIEGVVLEADSAAWDVDLTIFDAVGNVVSDQLDAVLAEDDSGKWNIVATWDGKNNGGRAVGSGSYLAEAVVNYQGKPKLKQTIIIGVKGINK